MIMAPNITHYISVFSMLICFSFLSHSQVGINTDNPAPGALLDINSSDKGILIPRVSLKSTLNYEPITPLASPTTGLLIYNQVTDGTGITQVTPGFYYWSGSEWRRLFNQGYTLKYEQTDENIASNSVNTPIELTGLDTGLINVPFSGTYQIIVNAFYAAGNVQNTSSDGAAQGSIRLEMSEDSGPFNILKETFVTSSSKQIASYSFNGLAQNVTILVNVDLDVTKTYQFKVIGEEWLRNNANRGYFGRNTTTAAYSGSTGNNAQRGSMVINLVKQF
jgi:hypothetical protein